jgi:uncharacterized membrane protein
MSQLVPLQEGAASGISPYNPLVVALVLLAGGAVISALFLYREVQGRHGPDDRGSFAWLYALIGGISLLVSGQLFWADWAGFPAAQYTELFGVALTMYAAVMLAAAFVIYSDLDPRPFTWLTAVTGLVLLQGANAIVSFSLTREPIVSAAIWAAMGLSGVLLLPGAYLDEDAAGRRYLGYVVVLLLVLAAGLSLFMAIEAHYGHIAEVATG